MHLPKLFLNLSNLLLEWTIIENAGLFGDTMEDWEPGVPKFEYLRSLETSPGLAQPIGHFSFCTFRESGDA